MSSRSKSLCITTFASPSKSVSRWKNNLVLDDLLMRIDDTMFDNLLVNQYRFDYFEFSDNENDEILDPNVTRYWWWYWL